MAEKILITGSSGFIGKNLRQLILKHGHDVVDFNSAQGDISSVPLEFTGITLVIHLAGKSFVPNSWKQPEEYMRVNLGGTKNVLEFCRKNSIPLLFMSSYVYGIPRRLPIDELHPVHPSNPYAQSKFEAEKLCMEYAEKFQLPVTIIRPFNIFGIGQSEHFLIPKILKQALDSAFDKIELMDITPKRDYIYLDDLVDAIILLMKAQSTGVFNIGSGYSMSVKEIAEKIIHISGKKKKIISCDEIRLNEIPDVVADISKIKNETGWLPKITFEAGIRRIVASEKN